MSGCEGGVQPRDLAEQVARRSYGKLVAFLAARTRDVAAAEDALSEAFAAALADWPRNGCPRNPEAWLMTVARRKYLDAVRSRAREFPTDDIGETTAAIEAGAEDSVFPDRRLGLMFACAHPAIDASIRAPLMLQAILGLDAARIASAFLVSPATMGQRLVRAKNKIRQAGIPLEVPERSQLRSRLDTVLDAIYAAFSEGWIDAAGTDVARRDLAEEAIYLGRVVVELLPNEPEGLGLLALMLHAEARRLARRNAEGDYIPLAQQNSRLWNAEMIAEAESLLHCAGAMNIVGRYQLEAAIQSAHAARTPHRAIRLGRYRATLRCTAYAERIAGGSSQPRPRGCRTAGCSRGPQGSECNCHRSATGRVSALLGRASGIAGPYQPPRRSTSCILDRHWP